MKNPFDPAVVAEDNEKALTFLREQGLLKDDVVDYIYDSTKFVLCQVQNLDTGKYEDPEVYELNNFETVHKFNRQEGWDCYTNSLFDQSVLCKIRLLKAKKTNKVSKSLSVAGKMVLNIEEHIDGEFPRVNSITDNVWAIPEYYQTGYDLCEDEEMIKEMFSSIFNIDLSALDDADVERMFDTVDHIIDRNKLCQVSKTMDDGRVVKFDLIYIRWAY